MQALWGDTMYHHLRRVKGLILAFSVCKTIVRIENKIPEQSKPMEAGNSHSCA